MMDESFFANLYTEETPESMCAINETLSSSLSIPAAMEVVAPDEFICPISLQPMVHPLTTRSGLSFERSAILNWLQQGSGVCPLTRQPLRPSDLIPNRQLETRIRFWRLQNNIAEPTADDDDFDAVSFLGFLPVGESKTKEVVSRHQESAAAPMTLRDVARAQLRARQRLVIDTATARSGAPSASITPSVTDLSTNSLARRPKEGRRNFLSRILKQTTEELDL
jgi:hypothetical protein